MTFKETVYTAARLWASMTDDDKGNLHFCDIVGHILRSKKKRKRHKARALVIYPKITTAKPEQKREPSYGWDRPVDPLRYAFRDGQRRPYYKTRCRMRNVNEFRGYRPEQPVMAV